MPKSKFPACSLGRFRELTKNLPDETIITPRFAPDDIPNDDQPGVQLNGIKVQKEDGDTIVALMVQLFYLEDDNLIEE